MGYILGNRRIFYTYEKTTLNQRGGCQIVFQGSGYRRVLLDVDTTLQVIVRKNELIERGLLLAWVEVEGPSLAYRASLILSHTAFHCPSLG